MPETLPVTGTVTAHRFVKLNSNGTSVSAAGAGETVYGVALDSANVNIAPATTPVERNAATVDAVGTLAVNDLVESDASGKAVALADGEAAGRVVSVTGTQVRVDLTVRSAGSSGSSPLLLVWDSDTTDYIPTESKDATGPKVFVGPTDPTTVTGAVLNGYDQWVETTF